MAKVKWATKLESCRFFRPTYLAQVLRLIPFIDPNHSRQTSLSLHDLCLEFLTVHGNEMRLFLAKASNYFRCAPDISAGFTHFNVFSVGSRFWPNTYQKISGCATWYAIVAVSSSQPVYFIILSLVPSNSSSCYWVFPINSSFLPFYPFCPTI